MSLLKSILVTGGSGFIGSHLIRRLIKQYPNSKILNLDALTYAGNSDNLKDCENAPNYEFVLGDINNFDILQDLFKSHDFDSVIHLAAESHVDNSIKNPFGFAKTNIQGTLNLLESAIKNLDAIKHSKGKKNIILGDMLELGKHSKKLHEKLANTINSSKIDNIYVYGKNIKHTFKKIASKKRRLIN